MTHDDGKPTVIRTSEPRDLGKVGHEVMQLAKLQISVFRCELRRWQRQLILPTMSLAAAVVVAISCVPMLMLSAAYGLAGSGLISFPLSLLIVAISSTALAGLSGLVAWKRIRNLEPPFDRFRRQLVQNLRAVKSILRINNGQNADLPSIKEQPAATSDD
jgi:hypothetical protein